MLWHLVGEDFLSPAPLRSSGHSAIPCNNWNHCGGFLSGCSRLRHIWNYQKTVTGTIITWPSHSLPVLLGLSAKTWAMLSCLFLPEFIFIHGYLIPQVSLVDGLCCVTLVSAGCWLFIVLLKITKLVFPRQGSASSQAMPTKKDRDVSCRTLFEDKCMYRVTPRKVFHNSRVSSH